MRDKYLEMLKEQTLVSRKNKNLLEQTELSTTDKIKKFFKENPYPSDTQVHTFADEIGIAHDELEKSIYAILTDYLKIGKHQDVPDSNFDQEQLSMGVEVEKEHTDDPLIAKEIAKDHLSEKGLEHNYYTLLKQMEEKANEGVNECMKEKCRISEERGMGQGVGGPRQRDAGASVCYCPSCGIEYPKVRGVPCNRRTCKKCGGKLVGK